MKRASLTLDKIGHYLPQVCPLAATFLYRALKLGNIWLYAKFERPTSFRFGDGRGFQMWGPDSRLGVTLGKGTTEFWGYGFIFMLSSNNRPTMHRVATTHKCDQATNLPTTTSQHGDRHINSLHYVSEVNRMGHVTQTVPQI